MINIRTAADMAETLRAPPDTTVSGILLDHVARLSEYEGYSMEELANFLIVQAGDRICDVDRALGFDILSAWPELAILHAGWWELVFVPSDDGLGGRVVLIKDDPNLNAELLGYCRSHAQPA